jgi:hypothetical protein
MKSTNKWFAYIFLFIGFAAEGFGFFLMWKANSASTSAIYMLTTDNTTIEKAGLTMAVISSYLSLASISITTGIGMIAIGFTFLFFHLDNNFKEALAGLIAAYNENFLTRLETIQTILERLEQRRTRVTGLKSSKKKRS